MRLVQIYPNPLALLRRKKKLIVSILHLEQRGVLESSVCILANLLYILDLSYSTS